MVPDISNDTLLEDAPLSETDRETETAAEIRQDSALLKLPIEIFQTITWHMDVGTFFASLLTCQHFYAAAQSKPTLFRHINSLPGLRLGLDDLSNADLLLRFRKRAAESGCAAGVLSDVTRFSSASRTPVSHAVFSPATPSEPGSIAQLVTVHEGSIIQIYDLGKHHVRHKTELRLEPSKDESGYRMDIVKMAISSGSRDLAILYRSWYDVRDTCVGPFEPGLFNDPTYKLVTFHRVSAKTKGYFYCSTQQEKRDVNNSEEEEEPVGLALASNGNACIAWKRPASQSETEIWLVGRDDKLMEACGYDPNPDVLKISDPPGLPASRYKERLIFNVQFVDNNSKLNFYKPGNPVHSWFTPTCNPSESACAPIFANNAYINNENIEHHLEEFAIGMPFHGSHSYNITVDWSTTPVCQTSYLALGMSRNRRDWSDHPDVFVVQADTTVSTAHCDHGIDLEGGRKLPSWKALALLAGYREGTSSLGTVVAVSPGGSRIAAATWSRVLVWSFSPRLLHQGELQHYFPVRDYNSRKGFGRLRPTLLSSEGVVHSMLWTNEIQLYATTDQGLVKWDMGHMSEGEREGLSLAYDAWPDTAVAAPVTTRAQQRRPVPVR